MNRTGKRPRIVRPVENRDENRSENAPRSYNREGSDRPRRSYRSDDNREERGSYRPRTSDSGYRGNSNNSGNYQRRDSSRSYGDRRESYGSNDNSQRRSGSYERRDSSNSYDRGQRGNSYVRRDSDSYDRPRRNNSYGNRDNNYQGGERRSYGERNYNRNDDNSGERRVFSRRPSENRGDGNYSKKKQLIHKQNHEHEETVLRLNRYIAKGGLCSRRDADALITAGRVTVNGKVVTELGVKVNREDTVEVDGNHIIPEKKVYLVLNKPKDYVTTMEDPLERKTVMTLIEGCCKERIYPIGRLDRQTTGVLLFTNDGDLAKKLTHPKYNQKKIYHVFLDKVVQPGHIQAIMDGIELEDGVIQADDVRVAEDDHTQVGIEIHSGRNRIVRRIFEHLDYNILRLDRVFFAGITKKNLPRGRWRFLTPHEVSTLKAY